MSYHPSYRHESWLHCALDLETLKKNIKNAAKSLKKQKFQFDSIAFRGMSGALLAAPLALATGKTLLMVRKKGSFSSTHSRYRVEGDLGGFRYIIVDDFIATGDTVIEIIRNIDDESKHYMGATDKQCIGILELRECNQWKNKKGYLKLRNPNPFMQSADRHIDVSDTEKYY